MIEYLCFNKFSKLHDNQFVFFSKYEFLSETFEKIGRLKNEVILITGNSDESIKSTIVDRCPSNVKYWLAQNCESKNTNLIPIPLGIENYIECNVPNHGVFWEAGLKKKKIFETLINSEPTSFIYSNFNLETNYGHRKKVHDHCNDLPFVTKKSPNLNLNDYYKDILNHKAIICPAGNGVDTHRLWETLYCGRIPITIRLGDFKIYDLYNQLPIIILNNIDELFDEQSIKLKIEDKQEMNFNSEILDYGFWEKKILNYKKTLINFS